MVTSPHQEDAWEPITPGGLEVPDHYATVRTDTREVLGVVGRQYHVFQNWEMFDFIDALLQEKLAVVEVCGSLRRGRHVWALLKLPGHIRVTGTDDVSAKYLLLTNSHDGSTTFRALFTVVRVVCWNTLSAALSRGVRQGVSLRHRSNMDAKVDEARRVLGIANEQYDLMGRVVDQLARHKASGKQVESFISGLFPIDDSKDERWREIVSQQRLRVQTLFEHGRGQDVKGIRGSAWALVNAVTEYVDWRDKAPRLKGFQAGESRLYSAWFGSGAALKERALDSALKLARIRVERN
jgi:phage/plasmid-like protein (TIGR03299 family)